MTSKERNALSDELFGIPSKRKYPLDTEAHTRSAIRFFNYVEKEDEEELAKNIIKAIKRFDITDIKIGKKNRFSKYYQSTDESVDTNPFNLTCNKCNSDNLRLQGYTFICNDCGNIVSELRESEDIDYSTKNILSESTDILNTGDKLIFFEEDAKYDTQLRKLLFTERMKKRKELLLLFDQVKKDCPFILYTFPELNKYLKRNLFIDLHYYNQIFFNNNTWVNFKGLNLYYDFLDRLLNKYKFSDYGYDGKTIFIPILDWDKNKDAMVWNFRASINPISIIYQTMYTGNLNKLKSLFGNNDIIFIGKDKYFKINFNKLEQSEIKKIAIKFKLFLIKICKGEEFDISDIDTSAETDSKEVITAKVIDKIEAAKGVDLTAKVALAKSINNNEIKYDKKIYNGNNTKSEKKNLSKEKQVKNTNLTNKFDNAKDEEKAPISKGTLNKSNVEKDISAKNKSDENIMKLANSINNASNNSANEDEALEKMDTEEVKAILMDIQSDGDDDVKISDDRLQRMNELQKKLMDQKVNGKSIQDILESKPEEIPKTNIEVSSPNNEEWKNLQFTNFDKNYNLEKDLVNAFRHFEKCSRPMVIRTITSEDNSTSEDRVMLYRVEYEDYRGKRYKVNLDIPIMKDNRFLLRGNSNSLQNQFFNMPIIKTEQDTCQIISNYNKIFIRRYNSVKGKSTTLSYKFVKAVSKYTGNKIKFIYANNTKISSKYTLPIDYIDLSGLYNKIETKNCIIYFNQDEIREKYKDVINPIEGIPYGYNKLSNSILYYTDNDEYSILYRIIYNLEDKEFIELINSMSSITPCSYSKCSILNTEIPMIVVCAYHEGLRKVLDKALINYEIKDKLTKEEKYNLEYDYIKFSDGYVYFRNTDSASLLLNGLKECPTDTFSLADIDNKNMYLSFLDNYGGRIKADGLENFYDLLIDPITEEILDHYKMPKDYVSILLFANALLIDNNYIRHNDTSSRRIRRYEIVAAYTYRVLATAYGKYCNELKHRNLADFRVNQDAVIVALLTDPTFSIDSCINALRDLETTNSVSTKGLSGMNSDRAYSLDKRTYDDSMLNVLGMSTGFAGNVGISRQATLNSNISDPRGFVNSINGDTSKMNDSNSLTATEALTPFGSNRDDPMRTAMTFIQTSKHEVRTIDSDPLLVTSGADEALAYMTSDRFAFKSKQNGVVEEVNEYYILIKYDDGTKEFIDLKNKIEKNSDGGYFVPLKLDLSKEYKIGDKISKNEIVAYDKYSFSNSVGESDNIAYNIGKLAKVAIVNTDEGFEDSGVITEKMSKKLGTPINYQYSMFVNKDTIIYDFLKVGDHVEVNDDLMTWISPYDDEGADLILKNLDKSEITELGKRSLKTSVTGTVTKVAIYRTVDIEELSDSLKKIVTNYERPLKELEKKLKENNIDISQIPAHYKLPSVGKLKGKDDGVLIEFYVEFLDTVGVGDKVVYFSANKAVEKSIIPEGLEPYTSFRPNESVDAFISETSIDKRMVTSTLIYGSLQKLMIELDRSVKDIMNIEYDDSTV